MSVVAFVPVRGGSKSIEGKNIKLVNGQPLVGWLLQALNVAPSVDHIVVSTDARDIKEIVLDLGLSKVEIYHRSEENAQDTSSTESAMLEYLNDAELDDKDTFILAQATSPFTSSQDIENGLQLFNDHDSVISCVLTKRFFWGMDGKPVNYDPYARPRRQDFDGMFMENGAFYINSVGNILRDRNRLSGDIGVCEMAEFTGLELDEPEDWVLAEKLMKQHGIHWTSDQQSEIKLVLSDLDGVLTDAGMYYSENGDELKKFSTYDGMGFELLRKKEIKTGIITSEDRELNKKRAEKMKLDYVFQGVKDKVSVVDEIRQDLGIEWDNIAYIGDDINDLGVLEKVGMAACPYNAQRKVQDVSGIIQLKVKGGDGAFREFVELILENG